MLVKETGIKMQLSSRKVVRSAIQGEGPGSATLCRGGGGQEVTFGLKDDLVPTGCVWGVRGPEWAGQVDAEPDADWQVASRQNSILRAKLLNSSCLPNSCLYCLQFTIRGCVFFRLSPVTNVLGVECEVGVEVCGGRLG